MARVTLFFLSTLLFFSCGTYREVQLTGVTLKEVKTTNDKFRVAFDMEVDNPNGYPITLSNPKLQVLVAHKALSDWSCPKKIKIKKNKKRTYPFYIEVSGGEALQLLPLLFFDPSIEIEGSIKVGYLFFGKRIPVSIKEKFN